MDPSDGLKRITRHRVSQKWVSSLTTKSRDNVDAESTAGQPPDRSGRADAFCGLVANFYSLKAKKIAAGNSFWKGDISWLVQEL